MRRLTSARLAAPVLLLLTFSPLLAHAACTFGTSSGGEVSLQHVFDNMFGAAAPNTQSACIADPGDGLWHTVDSVGSATILVEIAGNANGNALGIYDSASVLTSLEIFSGPIPQAGHAFITISGPPGAHRVRVDRFTIDPLSGDPVYAGHATRTFATPVFGFYLQQPTAAGGARFYSESFRNPGINGGTQTDYMYGYAGNGAGFLFDSFYAPDMVEGSMFGAEDAIIAWEDLAVGSDGDYQDMVVLLRDITAMTPVPIPAAGWLLGSALLALGLIGRRRRMPGLQAV